MNDHRELRESLAAYVLGALDPADRHAVEEHLHTCAECRDEVSRFSPLPHLLGRLSEEEAASGALARRLDLLPGLLAEETHERSRLRRHLLGWRVATAAAVAAAVLAWAPWSGPPAVERVPVSPVAAEAAAVTG
ncbi:MAG: zf-HC2 domain-containing protein, partial [Nitriliruptorales bacterium]